MDLFSVASFDKKPVWISSSRISATSEALLGLNRCFQVGDGFLGFLDEVKCLTASLLLVTLETGIKEALSRQ